MKVINLKKRLNKEQRRILIEKGTEMPFSSPLLNERRKGMFFCVACGNKIFDSKTKFDSGTGWPSFYDAVRGSVEFKEDNSLFVKRIEVICKKCKGHLGHVFECNNVPTKVRYCINGCVLKFKKEVASKD